MKRLAAAFGLSTLASLASLPVLAGALLAAPAAGPAQEEAVANLEKALKAVTTLRAETRFVAWAMSTIVSSSVPSRSNMTALNRGHNTCSPI